MHENTQPLDAWNYRTPHTPAAVVNARHPHADVVRLCIVNAQRKLNVVSTFSGFDSRHLTSADRYLRQALDALRPPPSPVPPSVAFWLGAEDDAP